MTKRKHAARSARLSSTVREVIESLERRVLLSDVTAPFPTPLVPRGTPGTLIFDGSASAALQANNDTASFTLELDAAQTLTLLVNPAPTLRPEVELRDSSNHQLAAISSGAAGKDALLQTVPIMTSGTFTIRVSSVGAASSGGFSLKATLNGALETENYGGPSNHTQQGAQNLDPAFFAPVPQLPGMIASVLGTAPPTQTTLYSEGFESGTLGAAWSLYASTVNGRSRVANTNGAAAGSYALLMDTAVTGNNLNEAIWTIDLSGAISPTLKFSSISFNDELSSLPTDFTGHFNGDGVAISSNGTNWHTIWTNQSPSTWTQITVDLASAAAQAGMTLGAGFKIKFQQFDNNSIAGGDGRGYDALSISAAASVDDYYSFAAAVGQTLTLAGKVVSGSAAHLGLRLLSSSGAVLSQGASSANFDQLIAGFTAPADGVYYANVSSDAACDYALTVTKDVDLDVESNDSLGLAKPVRARQVGGHREIVGFVEPSIVASQTITFDELPPGTLNGTTIKGVRFGDTGNTTFGYDVGLDQMYFVTPPLASGSTTGILTLTLPGPCSSFSFGMALSTVGTINNAVTVQLYNGSTLVAAVPVTTMSMPTFTEGGFSYNNLIVPVTKVVLDFNEAVATAYALDNVSYRLESTGGVDVYSVPLQAGEALVVRSYTPGDGTGEFGSTLDPAVELVDENGIRVEFDDNSAGDGRNAVSGYIAPAAGNYYIRVIPSSPGGHGEYALALSGPELAISAPADVQENAGGAIASLSVFPAPTSDLVVSLLSSNPSRLTVPASIIIPAGQTSVPIPVNVINNEALDGPDAVVFSATAAGYVLGSSRINVHDDETSTLTLSLPASISEGSGSLLGTISVTRAPAKDISILLSSSVPTRADVPVTVTLPAGQTSATFSLNPVNNAVIDGTAPVTISASVDHWSGATAQVEVLDDDAQISLSLPAAALWEGQNLSQAGKVSIGGTLPLDLVVNLLSSDAGELQIPATVTIPAGQTEALFGVTLPIDGIKDGVQTVQVSASAAGVAGTQVSTSVHDSDLDHFGFATISSPRTAAVPFSESVEACNINGEAIAVFAGSFPLNALGLSGSLPMTPASVNFVAGSWSGNVSINAVDLSVILKLDNGSGIVGVSNGFAVEPGPLTHFRWSSLANAQVANLPFAVTVTALDDNDFTATGFSGIASFSGKVGSLTGVLITPTSGAFVGGVWTGNVTVLQSALNMHLHVQDPAGNVGDSSVFDAVQRTLSPFLPTDVRENDGSTTGLLQISPAPATDLVVTLTNSKPSRLSIPATITVPAGQSSIPLPITIINNGVLDGSEIANISVSAAGYSSGSGTIKIHDNESTVLSVTLPPSASEGDGAVTGTIGVADPAVNDTVVQLICGNPSRATVPASVILPAGQTNVPFTLSLLDNATIDAAGFVSVTASVENWVSGFRSILVLDDDNNLTVTLPASGREGQTLSGAGTVRIGGTLTQDLLVNLLSSDTTELTVPASLLIPAGQTSATFDLALLTDALRDGAQTVTITASAPGAYAIASGSASMSVKDINLDHFAFDTMTGPQTATVGFPVTARAMNVDNEPLLGISGSATLSGLRPGGSIPVSPASITFASGVWTGNVVVNGIDPAVSLRIDQAGGISGQSNAFEVRSGPVASFQWSTINSPQYQDSPFPVTVRAFDANGFPVTHFNSSVNLSGAGAGQSVVFSDSFEDGDSNGWLNGSGTYTRSVTNQTAGDGQYSVTLIGGNNAHEDGLYQTFSGLQPRHIRFFTRISSTSGAGGYFTAGTGGTNAAVWFYMTSGFIGLYDGNLTYGTSCQANRWYRNDVDLDWVNKRVDYSIDGALIATNIPFRGPSINNITRVNLYNFSSLQAWWDGIEFTNPITVPAPLTPTSATFANGMWTGNLKVSSPATALKLTLDDGAGHTATSSTFDVLQRSLSLIAAGDLPEAAGTINGSLSVTGAGDTDLLVSLTSDDPSRLSVPSIVTIPAGQTSVVFPLTVLDNHLLDGLQSVHITAWSIGIKPASSTVTVHDDETAQLTVTLPSTVIEGSGNVSGTITASAAPSRDIIIQLTSSNPAAASVPISVTLPAGQVSAVFNLLVANNTVINPSVPLTVSAGVENWTPGSISLQIADDDSYVAVSLPAGGWEGQTLSAAGTVSIGGTLSSDLIVNLLSSNITELTVPAMVTIPAGQTSATFTLTLLNDGTADGGRTVHVSGSAAGLADGDGATIVHDAQLHHLGFDTITGPKTASVPFAVTARAYNIDNEVIVVYAGSTALSASGQAGALSSSPGSVTFSSGIWSGSVDVSAVDPQVALTLSTAGILPASSNSFVVQAGPIANFEWSTIPAPQYTANPVNVSLRATDINGYTVTNFNGTAALTGWSETAITSQTLLSNLSPASYGGGSNLTLGYDFTPNTTIQVTHVRSYFGTKVSIWTSSGVLVASQSMPYHSSGWVEAALSAPVTLSAGTTYRIGAYTPSSGYYWTTVSQTSPSFGKFGQSYLSGSDAFPSILESDHWFFVELRVNAPLATGAPVSPSTATFVKGVWKGGVSLTQATPSMFLRAIGSGQNAITNRFNVIQKALSVNGAAAALETDGTSRNITLSIPVVSANDTIITLTSSDPARISLPATCTIPAGQTSITFPLTIIDDSLVEGPQVITLSASAATFVSASSTVALQDDETASLTVTLPASVTEGLNAAGTVTSSVAPARDVVITLASSLTSRATVPAQVTLRAGQTSVNFTLTTIDDILITGNAPATISSTVSGWTGDSSIINVIDNDVWLLVTLPDGLVWEGQTLTGAGEVRMGGTLSSNLAVALVASDTSEVGVPAVVTIPAGQTYANFTITLPSDGVKDGAQSVTVAGTAAGVGVDDASIVVHDADVDRIVFDPTPGVETAGVPFPATVKAYNIDNEVIAVCAASGVLSAAGAAGPLSVTPASIALASGVWSGNITVNAVDPMVTLQYEFGEIVGKSNNFAVKSGPVAGFQWSAVGAIQHSNVPFSATITATDANGYTASDFNATASLSTWFGSIVQSQTMLSASTADKSANAGMFTLGYSFTAANNLEVTHIRSYFGTNVSIWSNTGTLLTRVNVAGTAGGWTETPLSSPLHLKAGVTYRISAYSAGQTYYWRTDMAASSAIGTINQSLFAPGDAFPTTNSSTKWPFVDLRCNVGTMAQIPVSPTTVTFTDGVWSGNVSIAQPALDLFLRTDAGAGHISNSSAFSVLLNAPFAPTLAAASDSGKSNADLITQLNNASPATSLEFLIYGTVAGATVSLYADGTLIGSAVASGAITTIRTDGTTVLPDGDVSITARQKFAGDESAASPVLTIRVDTAAPRVSSVALDINAAQTVKFESSEALAGIAGDDIVLQNLTTGVAVPGASISVVESTNHYTVSFPGFTHGILPDGYYTMTIHAGSVIDLAGNLLGSDINLDFFILAGDASRDAQVDVTDLAILAMNWQGTGKVFTQGDFNYDGKVDAADLGILSSHWQQSLPLPPAPAPVSRSQAPKRTATRMVSVVP
jgi:hypothetical protein